MDGKQLVAQLFDGAIDIVGDVHGEIDALRNLLARLGYSPQGEHAEGRRLVFVGDLCDRGPNSPAVILLVKQLVERGLAQCLIGNHELNLLRDSPKNGNGWFFTPDHDQARGHFLHCCAVDPARREAMQQFIASLPLALEREDVRVVHAAWIPESIAAIRQAEAMDAVTLYEHHEWRIEQLMRDSGMKQAVTEELKRYGAQLNNPEAVMPFLPMLAQYDQGYQMGNPVRVATSGVEQRNDHAFFVGGKWRMVRRVAWWHDYQDSVPVVMGHYWRCLDADTQHLVNRAEKDLFDAHAAGDWLGPNRNVYCVDFSVGGRYKERDLGRTDHWGTHLAAVRWPEREVVFDDGMRLALS